MPSMIEIGNIALGHLGVKNQVQSFDEASPEASVLKIQYPACRDHLLAVAPWPFASRRVILALETEDPPIEWRYRYVYPTDCLFARAIGLGREGVKVVLPDQQIPFELAGSDDADRLTILTDQPNAILSYTRRVVATGLMPPHFTTALGWYLASQIAPALTASTALAQQTYGRYVYAREEAIRTAFAEAKESPMPESEFMDIRI